MLFSNGFTIKNKLVSTVTLKIDGVDDPVGEIRIAIFDSENRYLENPSLAEIVPVSKTNIEWQIEDLAYGQYAIAVYHDKNKNGKLDTNILGIPLEVYGFSVLEVNLGLRVGIKRNLPLMNVLLYGSCSNK